MKRLVPAAALLCALLVAAGCGGGGGSQTIQADGSSTVGPFTTRAAENFKQAERGRGGDGRHLRHGRRLRALLPAARSTSPTPLGRSTRKTRTKQLACADAGDRVRRAARRERCADGRRQPRERLGDMPDRGAAESDLGAWLDGQELAGRRPELPRRATPPLRAGHRLGHVRLLHREIVGEEGESRHRLPGLGGRQRHPRRRLRRHGSDSDTSASPTSRRTRTR